MHNIWAIAEQHEGVIKQVSFELLHRGRLLADSLGTGLVSIVIGHAVPRTALDELTARGADEILVIDDERLSDFVCETYSNILVRLVREHRPHTILAAATSTGRTLMPHAAVKIGTGLTADCTELRIEEGTGNLLQTRPAIGGNIMATIKTPNHRPQMATVRPKSMLPLPRDPARKGTIHAVELHPEDIDERVKVQGYRRDPSGANPIEEADIVAAGGRGLKKGEHFALIQELAEELGAAVGASRDAVDRGWIGYAHQIGLSGKTISPKLYIGAGISGSVQHLAGIKTAENIISINSDPHAPIHQIADLSIVGDLFTVIPIVIRKLRQKNREVR
jgi:electron transfer flavoprotein alpha subunit